MKEKFFKNFNESFTIFIFTDERTHVQPLAPCLRTLSDIGAAAENFLSFFSLSLSNIR